MFKFLFLIAPVILSACVPLMPADKDPDIYNGYTAIQSYQKPESKGYTNVEQRRQDAAACGVRNGDKQLLEMNKPYPGLSVEQTRQLNHEAWMCMKSKGYEFLSPFSCTKYGKPLGVCN